MKTLFYSILIFIVLNCNLFSQQAQNYFPADQGFIWNFKVTPLDSLNNSIDSLSFIKRDSFAVKLNYQNKPANMVVSKHGAQTLIDPLPYTDTTLLHFESTNGWSYLKTIPGLDSIPFLDSIGLTNFIRSLEGWYSFYRFSQTVNTQYTILLRDTTITYNGTPYPLRFKITGKRFNDQNISVPFGNFSSKKFLTTRSISLLVQILPPPIPPVEVPIIQIPDTSWIANAIWKVKEYTPSTTVDLSLIGLGSFIIPGQITELMQYIPVNYKAGWNLVSVPIILSDSSKYNIFPASISYAYSFNGSYTPTSILVNGKGYWLKFGTQTINSFIGSLLRTITIPVVAGWNLIGSVDHIIPVPSDGIIQGSIYGYNNGYSITDSIYPGRGYWLKSRTNGTINLGTNEKYSKNFNQFPELSTLNNITISDAAGSKQVLYFGVKEQHLDNFDFELPPPPPSGIFDARFSSQKFLELYDLDIEYKDFPIDISSSSYPIKIESSILNSQKHQFRLIYSEEKKLISHELNDKTTFILNNALTDKIIIQIKKGNQYPTVFHLGQNYPNPFNPETKIKYQLPVESYVTIKIFNALGQEIITLVNSEQKAGSHTITWKIDENSEIGSGVYFYRMNAKPLNNSQNFSDVKKLLFLK